MDTLWHPYPGFTINWVGLDPAYCLPLPRELVRGSYGPPTRVSVALGLWVGRAPPVRPPPREWALIRYGPPTRVSPASRPLDRGCPASF